METKHMKRLAKIEWIAVAGLLGTLGTGVVACRRSVSQAPIVTNGTVDPALANMAEPEAYTGITATSGPSARVMGQSVSYAPQASGESYGQQTPAPIVRQVPGNASSPGYNQPYQSEPYPTQSYQGPGTADANAGGQAAYDPNEVDGYDDSAAAGEEAIEEADQPPPPLPEYDQPPAPEDDYLWTPGYWDYADAGYYWVPGAWVAPPFYGALWTPPWWGYYGGRYRFHRGYWGPHVGYYGGINYGFGYIGFGYFGGYWRGHDFIYNRAVTNIGSVRNYYSRPVVFEGRTYGPRPIDRVSFNGGRGGIMVRPRPAELAALREAHYAPVAAQREIRVAAASNRAQFFQANRGRPAQAFAGRPLGSNGNISAAPSGPPVNRQTLSRFGAQGNGYGRQGGGFGNQQGERAPYNGQPGNGNQQFNRGGRDQQFNRQAVPGQPAGVAPTQGNNGVNRDGRPLTGNAPDANNPGRGFGQNNNGAVEGNRRFSPDMRLNRDGQAAPIPGQTPTRPVTPQGTTPPTGQYVSPRTEAPQNFGQGQRNPDFRQSPRNFPNQGAGQQPMTHPRQYQAPQQQQAPQNFERNQQFSRPAPQMQEPGNFQQNRQFSRPAPQMQSPQMSRPAPQMQAPQMSRPAPQMQAPRQAPPTPQGRPSGGNGNGGGRPH